MRSPRSSRPRAVFVFLEPRLVFDARAASTYEQFMLELVNRARANPVAEASRLGIGLNEGVTGTQISTAAKPPLAINPFLTGSARDHVGWLRVNSVFQHEGSGGSSPHGRMAASGYVFTGGYGSAENLAVTFSSTLGDMAQRVETLYRNLFVDEGVAGRGHRTNMMNASMEEIGVGVASGDYTRNGSTYTAILAGQNFAYSGGNPFLTGVVYADNLKADNFYSPGEGKNAITVTATSSSGASYTATTGIAGGYSLQLPAGTYTVTASGAGVVGTAKSSNVVVGSTNVKRDFEAAQFSTSNTAPAAIASISSGTLNVSGTKNNDTISVLLDGTSIEVQVNAITLRFKVADVKRVSVNAGNGNDHVRVGEQVVGASILGGLGNDTIFGTANNDQITGLDGNDQISAGGGNDIVNGGTGNDTIIGEGGKDIIHGDEGEDRLNGSGGNDQVFGDADNDRVYGGSGNDTVDGGGNVDRVYGDDGDDAVNGGSSNDRLYGSGGNDTMAGGKGKDYFDGGAGTNHARDRESIESVLNVIG